MAVTTLQVERAPVEAAPRRKEFRPDIEGLRAIAVLSVLTFHAAVPGFAGGFVGVDVFFVISGYLITGQLVRELERTGKVRLGAFYARRARRLIPPAAVVLGVTALASFLLLPALTTFRVTGDLFSALFYYANWGFIAQGNDYLAANANESPALHFWSLAVEEQFYLAWPLMLLLAWAVATRRLGDRRKSLVVAVAVASVGSFVLSYWLTSANPGLAYMATYTRAWQFGLGALVALVMARGIVPDDSSARSRRQTAGLIGLLGVAAIIGAVLAFDQRTPYPGSAALYPTVGAAAVILAGPASWIGFGLANPLLRLIGRISYSWYLWHWPVIIIAHERMGDFGWHTKALLTLASVIPAILTYLLVERLTQRSPVLQGRVQAAGALGVLASVLAATLILSTGTVTANSLGSVASSVDNATFAKVFGAGVRKNSGAVNPSPLDASADIPDRPECLVDGPTNRNKPCLFGSAGGRKVVLVGDSHAHQWQPALQQIAAEDGWQLIVMARSGCPIADIAPRLGESARFSRPACTAWRALTIERIQAMKPALVVFTNLKDYIPQTSEIAAAWRTTIDEFRKSGARLAYIRDAPSPGFDIPECVSGALRKWSTCSFEPPYKPEPVVTAVQAGQFRDVKVLDLNGYLCDGKVCPAVRNGTLMYRDSSHLTATAVRLLTPALRNVMNAQGLS